MRLYWYKSPMNVLIHVILSAFHGVAVSCITFVTIFCLVVSWASVDFFDFIAMGSTISIFFPFFLVYWCWCSASWLWGVNVRGRQWLWGVDCLGHWVIWWCFINFWWFWAMIQPDQFWKLPLWPACWVHSLTHCVWSDVLLLLHGHQVGNVQCYLYSAFCKD